MGPLSKTCRNRCRKIKYAVPGARVMGPSLSVSSEGHFLRLHQGPLRHRQSPALPTGSPSTPTVSPPGPRPPITSAWKPLSLAMAARQSRSHCRRQIGRRRPSAPSVSVALVAKLPKRNRPRCNCACTLSIWLSGFLIPPSTNGATAGPIRTNRKTITA